MNTLEIKHVADLLTMRFNIPSYQRGYRWEKKHVDALLDDLYNFIEHEKVEGRFYCLQPLVVVMNCELSGDGPVYDIIDGQQRLTTLYLLLTYLSETRKSPYEESSADMFSIKYESRDAAFFENNEFQTDNVSDAANNIDFFYMTMAYKAIDAWFDSHKDTRPIILKSLIPEGYQMLSGLTEDSLEKAKKDNDKKNDARFIWYEISSEDRASSIEVFSQLNYGKTPLTPSELVKAQIFQCDLYGQNEKLMKEVAFRRSCEWDMIEKQLQDPFMWSMIASTEDYMPSHIDFLLSFVFEDLYNELKSNNKELDIDREADDFIYQVCTRYLETDNEKVFADMTGKIWDMVQSTYTIFYNWYQNTDFFHLIGLLNWLKGHLGKSARRSFLRSLMTEYHKSSKQEFTDYLKSEIAKIIEVPEQSKDGDGNVVSWGISKINYMENPRDIIRILVMFNVEQQRLAKSEGARFPFHLLRKFNITSLEHIHPQNLNMNNIKVETIREWIEIKENNLMELNKYEKYKKEINSLKTLIKDEDSYKTTHYEKVSNLINKIDEEFDELVQMKQHPNQMHTLYNLALVDKDTNAALSNKLLDEKRKILIQRQKDGKTYIMPATMMVFNKYFSDKVDLPKLWTRQDREAYFNAISIVYTDYIGKLKR